MNRADSSACVLALVIAALACGDAQSSSRSHWAVCGSHGDCSSFGATCGGEGYCLDSSGQRVQSCDEEACAGCAAGQYAVSSTAACAASSGICYPAGPGQWCTAECRTGSVALQDCQTCACSEGRWACQRSYCGLADEPSASPPPSADPPSGTGGVGSSPMPDAGATPGDGSAAGGTSAGPTGPEPSGPDASCAEPGVLLQGTVERVIGGQSYQGAVTFGPDAVGQISIFDAWDDARGADNLVIEAMRFNRIPALPFRFCVADRYFAESGPGWEAGRYKVLVELRQHPNQSTIGDMTNGAGELIQIPSSGVALKVEALEDCNAPATASFVPGGYCTAGSIP